MWVSALATRKDSHHLQRWGSLQKRKKKKFNKKIWGWKGDILWKRLNISIWDLKDSKLCSNVITNKKNQNVQFPNFINQTIFFTKLSLELTLTASCRFIPFEMAFITDFNHVGKCFTYLSIWSLIQNVFIEHFWSYVACFTKGSQIKF